MFFAPDLDIFSSLTYRILTMKGKRTINFVGAMPDTHELAGLCKALSHPARIKILKHLLDEDHCICGRIVEVLPLAQSTVSQHLKILKESGLILGEVEGPRTCYCVDKNRLALIGAAVAALLQPENDRRRL